MENNTPNVEPKTPHSVLPRVVFFAFIAVALALFWYFTRPENMAAPTGEAEKDSATTGGNITLVQGAVEYKSADGTWKRAEKDTKIAEGDTVEIVGAGRAIVSLPDGSSVRLGDNSSVSLTQLSDNQMTVTNEKGLVYAKVAKSERVFDVVVGDNTYEAQGTAYKTINTDEVKGVEVYESKVKILGGEKEVGVDNGYKYYVYYKSFPKLENKLIKITNADLSKDTFVKWNNTLDAVTSTIQEVEGEKISETKKTTAVETTKKITAAASSIVLTGKSTSNGVYLSWTVNNLEIKNGFKVVRSSGLNPVYPGNDYVYLSNNSARSYTWEIKDGQSYYFRVCKYIDGVCTNYSNNLLLTAPTAAAAETSATEVNNVSSIYVSASGNTISWRTVGKSPLGFKLVWSKNAHPTYPTREEDKYNYYSDPEQAVGIIDAFDESGKYYVRVCEYLGGKCGVYSNEIEVTL